MFLFFFLINHLKRKKEKSEKGASTSSKYSSWCLQVSCLYDQKPKIFSSQSWKTEKTFEKLKPDSFTDSRQKNCINLTKLLMMSFLSSNQHFTLGKNNGFISLTKRKTSQLKVPLVAFLTTCHVVLMVADEFTQLPWRWLPVIAWSMEISTLRVSVCVSSSDGGTQHWLVGPDVGGPAAPAGRSLPAGGGQSGGGGGRHGAQHAVTKTQEQHLVSRLCCERVCVSWNV